MVFVLKHRCPSTASRAFLNRSCAAPSPCAWRCVRFVALDLVLRLILARVAWVPLVLGIAGVDLNDPAAHMPGLGIPTDVIADFELRAHTLSPDLPPATLPSILLARAQILSTAKP